MTTVEFRIWRGNQQGGAFHQYTTEVDDGMVVLDAVLKIQAEQANDLAARWNCKAGKCGSCSAEVNGIPRLMCMTRLDNIPLDNPITVEPMQSFPPLKDLVTDVSWNFEAKKKIKPFKPRKPDAADGTWRMEQEDVDRVQEALTDSTRALLVSHLHGGQVDMPALRKLADQNGVAIIEDACQVPGARVAGRVAGSWGEVAVLSFGGSKLLSAGRGGALLTSDDGVQQRVKTYTQRGNDAYPLSELQAALLQPQLDTLADRNRQRATAATRVIRSLADHPAVTPCALPGDPQSQPGLYKLGLQYNPDACAGLSRDAFARAVRAEGVAIDPGFRSLHKSHSQRRFSTSGELVEADEWQD